MAKLALNKTSLKRERDQLQLCNRVLPPLDMKRRQLSAELRRARRHLAEERARYDEMLAQAREQLPMLAYGAPNPSTLVSSQTVQVTEENMVGVRLPVLQSVEFQVSGYDHLVSPPWTELLVEHIQRAATQRVRIDVAAERVERLDHAVRRVTQRVNLFEKVLIPTIRGNIKRIQSFLADAERAAVVRSKIAKAMHASVAAAVAQEEAP